MDDSNLWKAQLAFNAANLSLLDTFMTATRVPKSTALQNARAALHKNQATAGGMLNTYLKATQGPDWSKYSPDLPSGWGQLYDVSKKSGKALIDPFGKWTQGIFD